MKIASIHTGNNTIQNASPMSSPKAVQVMAHNNAINKQNMNQSFGIISPETLVIAFETGFLLGLITLGMFKGK